MPATQANRILSVTTPLGPDVLMLGSFSGTEGMSRLFSYQLHMASETATAVEAKDIVGKSVTWCVQHKDADPRYFNGFVSRFSAGESSRRNTRSYHAQVVPWLWFLTRTSNCRIFQKKSVPEIVEQVFGDFGFSDYTLELGSYGKREYCVQYRETAFNFVSRLLEEEGMFYFFRHEDGKHTLVLADKKGSYSDLPAEPSPPSGLIETWQHEFEFRPGKWARTDYNFETPSTPLLTNVNTVIDLPGISKYEMFDFPGDYMVKGVGETGTKLRMEEEEVPYEVVTATSASSAFTPGGKFKQEGHDAESEKGKGYVVTSIEHSSVDVDFVSSSRVFDYRNKFQCIPDSVTFRPGRSTPRPIIAGAQTAVVVGPAGEEIYVDKYGRVKVQFFWDREGKKDENSSCWIRVSEQWAGKNWGMVCHPRIGQEVIVEFLEGDPDRPLITGRVYNAEQMPPYDLPGNKTQTGIKTRSTLKGTEDNFNEIRFEDKKGDEQLYIHAEKNQDIVVEKDETHTVGNDRTKTIARNETTTVGKDRTETVKKDETITIKGNRTETVEKDETIIIKGNRTETVTKDETITIKGNRTETVDKDETITIKKNRQEKVTENESVAIDKNRSHTIKENDTLDVGKNLSVTAGEMITLKTGEASITMNKDGTITIKGKDITIDASGKINVNAKGDIIMKGAKIGQN